MKGEGDEALWRRLMDHPLQILHTIVIRTPMENFRTLEAMTEYARLVGFWEAGTLPPLATDMEVDVDLSEVTLGGKVRTEEVQAPMDAILTTVGNTTTVTSPLVYFPAPVAKAGSTPQAFALLSSFSLQLYLILPVLCKK